MASLSHHPRLTVNHQMHPIPIHKHSQVIFLYRIASYLYNKNISYMVPSCQTLLNTLLNTFVTAMSFKASMHRTEAVRHKAELSSRGPRPKPLQ